MPRLQKRTFVGMAAAIAVSLTACDQPPAWEADANEQGHTAPTALTIAANQAVLSERPFENRDDFVHARRGLIAQDPALVVDHLKGGGLWDMTAFEFIDADGNNAPDSVNPSLWRQAALNNIHGLFEVTEGIYQIRGYDLSTMSIIQGDSGWIIVDPLTTHETAKKAFAFVQQELGEQPVKAIIVTHSHIDHFGGINGILELMPEDDQANLQVIAPAGFSHEASSENVIAGTAMGRRATFMYGRRLQPGERGHVDIGLGKAVPFGTFGFANPTLVIDNSNTEQQIDGVDFQFQIVSGSEAPAEFTFYLPAKKAFCGAEMVSHNMHNIYTLRGAKVRDALLWSNLIEESRLMFADADVYFGSHHWPIWGQEKINAFLEKQRDTYKFIHDQTVRLLNQGFTPNEIASQLALPEELKEDFFNQGYYGTLKHNAKAVYQNYLGWYSANPADLDPLPEPESAKRYMALMGGVDNVVAAAQQEFDDASSQSLEEGLKTYRWLAELLNHAVFAEPDNNDAKALLAKVYDQLGYQAESGPWRSVYLSGAYELRHGGIEEGVSPAIMKDVLLATPVEEFFKSMAVRLIAEKAAGENRSVLIRFNDIDESYLLTVNRSVLHHRKVSEDTKADATLILTKELFVRIIIGEVGIKELAFGDELEIEGSLIDLASFFAMLDQPKGTFNIVTP